MSTELKQLFEEIFAPVPAEDGYTPNLQRPGDAGALLTGFLLGLQQRGGDVARWTEADWAEFLKDELNVPEEYLPDYLETVASWGIVDDAYWFSHEFPDPDEDVPE